MTDNKMQDLENDWLSKEKDREGYKNGVLVATDKTKQSNTTPSTPQVTHPIRQAVKTGAGYRAIYAISGLIFASIILVLLNKKHKIN